MRFSVRYQIPKNPLKNADIGSYKFLRRIQKPRLIFAICYEFFAIEFFKQLHWKNCLKPQKY